MIEGLLCEILGSKRTAWEGGMFPMTIQYYYESNDDTTKGYLKKPPPKVKFPNGFVLQNVYPSGRVCVSTFMEEEGYNEILSLPEIIFEAQQLLRHTNPDSASQAYAFNLKVKSFEEYDTKMKEQTSRFSKDISPSSRREIWESMLWEGASSSGSRGIHRSRGILNIETEAHTHTDVRPELRQVMAEEDPVEPSFPSQYKGCHCSCCAWGQTFWDMRRRCVFSLELVTSRKCE